MFCLVDAAVAPAVASRIVPRLEPFPTLAIAPGIVQHTTSCAHRRQCPADHVQIRTGSGHYFVRCQGHKRAVPSSISLSRHSERPRSCQNHMAGSHHYVWGSLPPPPIACRRCNPTTHVADCSNDRTAPSEPFPAHALVARVVDPTLVPRLRRRWCACTVWPRRC